MYSPEFLKPNGFKVGRPLLENEKLNSLRINEEQNEFNENSPHYQLSVIQLNSTFVEITDRNYPVRGIFTTLALFVIAGMSWLWLATMRLEVGRWETIDEANRSSAVGLLIFVSVTALLLIAFSLYGLFRESFSYTHFPIRLNRKTRKIYIWRRDGTVLAAPWAEVFFCLRRYDFSGLAMWDILGHVLEADRITVKETFALSSYRSSDANDLRMHWEYFRRYMEEGPEQPHRMLEVCLPLAKRRETWWEGCMRLSLNLHGSIFMQATSFIPFDLPASIGRMFAMRTSKIPRWPDWVEQECAIAKDDPYVRESGYVAPRKTKAA
jgi:hypothetical protein